MIDLRGLLIVGAVLFLFTVTPNASAKVADVAAPMQKAETFLSKLMAERIGPAYDELFAGSSIASKPQAVALLKNQTATVRSLYGKLLGYERVSSRTFGDSVVRLLYIMKYEVHPIVFEFYFYRVSRRWILVKVQFNDQFSLLPGTAP